ncbi:hypothetical protein [Penaeicola halotolerans]|uniref:hypothetical protein n=1 Tax=Penaeicola halotolerans TaxID=2793196 RepID=UPI001CF87B62|nr:hypothetical protein [Penaeicola halotolerans]
MKFTNREKDQAILQFRKEWEKFSPPKEIDERIFELYCEDISGNEIIATIAQEFDTKDCYANRCLYYATHMKTERKENLARHMYLDCTSCTESCIPERFRES